MLNGCLLNTFMENLKIKSALNQAYDVGRERDIHGIIQCRHILNRGEDYDLFIRMEM